MKSCLKNRKHISAYVNVLSELLLTNKEDFRRYLHLTKYSDLQNSLFAAIKICYFLEIVNYTPRQQENYLPEKSTLQN